MKKMVKRMREQFESQRGSLRRALVLMVTVAVVVSSLPTSAFAYALNGEGEGGVITGPALQALIEGDGANADPAQNAAEAAPADAEQVDAAADFAQDAGAPTEPADADRVDSATNSDREADDSVAPSDTVDVPSAPAADADGAVSAESGFSAENVQEADVPMEGVEQNGAPVVQFGANGSLGTVTISGDARGSRSAAFSALKNAGADDASAREMSDALFSTANSVGSNPLKKGDVTLPHEADGTSVEQVAATWKTEDTKDNKNADLLYLKPANADDQSVAMRVNYAIAGPVDYPAGSITIIVPAYMFVNRAGGAMGRMRLSVPEEPSTRMEWNYKLVGDTYQITNTRKLPAAITGYMEFAIEGLRPFEMVDMKTSLPFDASVEVTTNAGTLIGKKSNELTAQFDTEAKIAAAKKKSSEEPRIVESSYIPEAQRVPGESHYLVAKWYMNAATSRATTQQYTVSFVDEKNDEYKGFIIGQTDGDAQGSAQGIKSSLAGNLNNGQPLASVGETKFTVVEVAYPFSQFKKNTVYTLKNKVTYSFTELDPRVEQAGAVDEQLTTTASSEASVEWSYANPTFDHPVGDVSLYVYGTMPNASGSGMKTTAPSGSVVDSDLVSVDKSGASPFDGYYGKYPKGLNDIQDNANPVVSYTLNTIGYLLPFTYKKVKDPVGTGDPQGMPENYGHVPITLTTEDLGLSLNDTGAGAVYDRNLKAGEDFTYTAVEFPERPHSMKGVFVNLDENGNSTALPGQKTGIEYEPNTDVAVTPDVVLQVKRNGAWEDYAVASWHETGEIKLTVNGVLQDPGVARVQLPADTQGVRTVTTTANAAILYHVRVFAALHNAGKLGKQVAKAFEGSTTPKLSVWNYAALDAKSVDGSVGMKDVYRKRAHNVLQGYTTDTSAKLSASVRSSEGDIDYNKRQVKVRYSAEMHYQSHIASKVPFEEAMKDGRLLPQEGATWYSLLPKGFAPQMDSIRLRRDDVIRGMHTIENFRGTGRTLLVVSADLAPHAAEYEKDGVRLYEDVPSISFSAVAGFEAVEDFGTDTHNVFVYQSENESLGSVEGYLGEPDDPRAGNNVGSVEAFATDAERDALTDLDPATNNSVFLYAGATQQLPDALKAGNTGLSKMAMVGGDGIWSNGQGQGYMSRVAYYGGDYSYRLAIQSGENNVTSRVVLYDSLENFTGVEGAAWKGAFERVDVSALKKAGCAPKIYYSTQDNLQFEEQVSVDSDSLKPIKANLDLKNGTIWQPLTDKTDPATVKAIAIDASKKADGSDFVLESGARASAIVHMRAPKQVAVADAHAYNAMYVSAVAGEPGSGATSEVSRSDYTMVGLKDYSIAVMNTWNDGYNRDGKRPTELVLHLYANGMPADEAGYATTDQATITLTEDGGWKGSFGTLPSHADDGSKIIYSIKEDVPLGYTAEIRLEGEKAAIVNTHDPELVTIKGAKTWSGDNPEVRPSSIKVELYRDGERVGSRTVRPNSIGLWSYEFRDLYKYAEGREITYTVKEDMAAYPSYASTVNGFDIHNVYHPYGDLVVSKEVLNTSEASRDKVFTFDFEFSRKAQDAENAEPVFTEYAYTVYEGELAVSEGTVATNGSIELKGGQRAVIHNVDEGVSYSVTEREVEGFTADEATKSGTIVPNQIAEAAFVNTYKATSVVNFQARKGLLGRALQKGLFNFELVDANTGSVIRTASNQAADVHEEAGGKIAEAAPVVFGATTYTQADHGKTFDYLIREMDSGLKGYTYSKDVFKVSVSVLDNGDGTLNTTVSYAASDGTPIDDPLSLDNGVLFLNEYAATAEVRLQAMKKLSGGTLQDGQFTFFIGTLRFDKDGAAIPGDGPTACNAADGTISFDPVVFSQDDAGRSVYLVVGEMTGSDSAVVYDDHLAFMKVDVKDNGDGTLSLATKTDGFDVPCWEHQGDSCPICGGDKLVTPQKDAFVFHNAYKDGSLTIEKSVPEGKGDPDNPDKLFDFRVELTNEEGQPVEVKPEDVAIGKVGEPARTPVDAAAENEGPVSPLSWLLDRGREALGALAGLFKPEQAFAATATVLPDSGTNEGWSWSIDAAGNLTIGGSKIAANDDKLKDHAADVKTVVFKPGSAAVSLKEFFLDFKNMTSVTFNGLNVESVDNVESMFRNCSALETIDMRGLPLRVGHAGRLFENCSNLRDLQGFDIAAKNAGNAIDVFTMFQGCSSLTQLDLSNVNISGTTNMDSMFNGCSGLVALDVSGFDTRFVTSMKSTFENCDSLKRLDLSAWDCSKVESMNRMFWSCSGLENVTLPLGKDWVLSDTSSMFNGCTALSSADLSGTDLSSVVSMASMFDGCSSLTSVMFPVSGTSKVMSMNSIFSNCSSLKAVDFAQFDLSSLISLEYAFYYCTALERVSLPRVDAGSLTNLYQAFSQCKNLEELDFSNFDLSKLKFMNNSFSGCTNLSSVVFPEAHNTAVTSLAFAFSGCTKLASVDFSKFDLGSVTTMESAFENCSALRRVDLPKVEKSALKKLSLAFSGCGQLQGLDFSGFDLSSLEKMNRMCEGCKSLESVVFPQSGKSALVDMAYAFKGCSALTTADFSSYDMSAVSTMEYAFANCQALTTVRMPAVLSSSVLNMSYMFNGCIALGELELSKFDLSNLTSANKMFGGCKQLTSIKFPSTPIAKLSTATEMLSGCSKLTEVDLSSFAPKADTNFTLFFSGCSSLRKVVLGDQFMFRGSQFPDGSLDLGGRKRSLNWIRVDGSGVPIGSPISAAELSKTYVSTPAPAGTYVWNTFALVDFDVNGGNGQMPRAYLDLEKGGDLVLPTAAGSIERPGYEFRGWNTAVAGTGTPVADGATLTTAELFKLVNNDLRLTLHAQWNFVPSIDGDPSTGSFEFQMPAGYQAHIDNLPAGTTYRVYENTPAGWQLVQVNGDSGVIMAKQEAKASFVNEFRPDAASARITATKKLDGAWAQPESGFTFTLTETTGGSKAVVQRRVGVGAGGSVDFTPIEYDAVGTHTYEITEDQGGDVSITYDVAPELVTVNVTSEDGKLKAAVTYDAGDADPGAAEFNNTTKPGSLSIVKEVKGASGASAKTEFSFMLMLGGVPYAGEYQVGGMSATAADGIIKLKGGQTAMIADIPAGTPYTVSETSIPSGWSLTGSEGTSGTIAAGGAATASFTNEYAASGEAQLVAYKRMDHAEIADGHFSFQLLKSEADGTFTPVATAMNGQVDNATDLPGGGDNPVHGMAPVFFPVQTYSAAGVYKYVMREVVPGNAVNADGVPYEQATPEAQAKGGFVLDGVEYDPSEHGVTVEMTDSGNGSLSASVTYGNGGEIADKGNLFTNVLQKRGLAIEQIVPEGELNDANRNAKFTFEVSMHDAAGKGLMDLPYKVFAVDGAEATSPDGQPVTGIVSDGGSIELGANQYAVIEGLPHGASYSVTEDAPGGWQLVADQTLGTAGTIGGEDARAVFTNVYEAVGSVEFKAFKKLDGGAPKEGQFSFALRDVNEDSADYGKVIQEVRNGADGSIAFKPVDFTEADHGKTLIYEIFEVAHAADGDYVFDSRVVKATVEVHDNGDGTLALDVKYDGKGDPFTFENWVAVMLARTGGPGVGLAGALVVAAGCVLLLNRRRRHA